MRRDGILQAAPRPRFSRTPGARRLPPRLPGGDTTGGAGLVGTPDYGTRLTIHHPPGARLRLITSRWIWLVPSKICMILASRM